MVGGRAFSRGKGRKPNRRGWGEKLRVSETEKKEKKGGFLMGRDCI